MDFWLAITCIISAYLLALSLAVHNLKKLRQTKQQRLEAHKAWRKKHKPWWYSTVKAKLDEQRKKK